VSRREEREKKRHRSNRDFIYLIIDNKRPLEMARQIVLNLDA